MGLLQLADLGLRLTHTLVQLVAALEQAAQRRPLLVLLRLQLRHDLPLRLLPLVDGAQLRAACVDALVQRGPLVLVAGAAVGGLVAGLALQVRHGAARILQLPQLLDDVLLLVQRQRLGLLLVLQLADAVLHRAQVAVLGAALLLAVVALQAVTGEVGEV